MSEYVHVAMELHVVSQYSSNRRTGFNCVVQLLHLSLFSYIANLIIASVQIAHRGGLLIE